MRWTTVNCPMENGTSIASLGVTFAYYQNPLTPIRGTIVFISDGDGTSPTGSEDPDLASHTIAQYISDYYNARYQLVQTAWDSPEWEDPTGTDSGGNIGYAACRPATFLAWVRFLSGIWTTGGMCVQGESAGGAAAVYALAWYGAGSGTGQYQNYIDKLSLLSSPPLSDIELGCAVGKIHSTPPPEVTVCPSSQLGCNPNNNPLSWIQSPVYTDAAAGVRDWTGLNSCAGSSDTSSADNAAWAMSIVDGNIGAFNYPNTNITGWLCSTVQSPYVMNNSSPQAQLFFQQFTSSSQIPKGLTINGVSGCPKAEEVGGGTPPSNYGVTYGWQAIEADMKDSVNGCVVNH